MQFKAGSIIRHLDDYFIVLSSEAESSLYVLEQVRISYKSFHGSQYVDSSCCLVTDIFCEEFE